MNPQQPKLPSHGGVSSRRLNVEAVVEKLRFNTDLRCRQWEDDVESGGSSASVLRSIRRHVSRCTSSARYAVAAFSFSSIRRPLSVFACSLQPFASSSSVKVGSQSAVYCPLLRMEQFWTRLSIDNNKGLVEHLLKFGYNATISAPHMHAICLDYWRITFSQACVFDVGSGTGYLTACFSMMVGPEGRAVGVEHIPELVASSIQNINKSAAAALMKEGSLSVHVADGRLGWPELAPYDAIHVGAAAPEIPKHLLDQLKPGGRMVIPVGNLFQDLKVVDKNLDGSVTTQNNTSVRYVPLTSQSAQLKDF
ncbi:hypothetical protein HPP92_020227 [Vanilla planifolia]|uniref:Protein-L-isoaspartate O-methyltransferase n=1 Tax=Vanilla planifolia TaxID=51239 RepID=A0A835Q3R8_VANPL|nr:hypothetical protein HPP92_020227 [Vanilla planifolia]